MKRNKEQDASMQNNLPSTSKDPDKNQETIARPVFKGLPHIVPLPSTSQNRNVRILHLSPIKSLPNKNVTLIPLQGTPLPKLNLANFQKYHLPMTAHGKALRGSNITVLSPVSQLPQSRILQNPGIVQLPHQITSNNSARTSSATWTLSNSVKKKPEPKSKHTPPIIKKKMLSPRKNMSSPSTSKVIEKAQRKKKKNTQEGKVNRVNTRQSSSSINKKMTETDRSPRKKPGRKKRKGLTDKDENEILTEENLYVADGFRADVETLLEKCSHVYKLNFEKFSDIWKEMNFPLIFHGRQSAAELAEMSEEVILIAKAHMLAKNVSFEENVAGLFLVYALLNHQPFPGFASLRLVPGDTPQVLEVMSEARRQKRHDVLYILGSVLIKGPCQYHVLPREVALEVPLKKYHDGTVLVPQPMESAFTRAAPCVQQFKDLTSLESRYHALLEKLRAKQAKPRNLCSLPASRLHDLYMDHIPQGRYFDSVADPLTEHLTPEPERTDVVSSIKKRAMAQAVDSMRHLTGIQDRTQDVSSSSSESEPDERSRKKSNIKQSRCNAKTLQDLFFAQEDSDDIEIISTQSQREMPSLDGLEDIAIEPCEHNDETINNIDKSASISINDNAKRKTKLNKTVNEANEDNSKPNENKSKTNNDKSPSKKAKTKVHNDSIHNNVIETSSLKKTVVYENSSVLIVLKHLNTEEVNTENVSGDDKQVKSKKIKRVANKDVSKDVSQETNEDQNIVVIDEDENKEHKSEESVKQEKEKKAIDTNKDNSKKNKEADSNASPRMSRRKRKTSQDKLDNIDEVKNIEIQIHSNCSAALIDAQSNTKSYTYTTSDEETLVSLTRKRKSNRINSQRTVEPTESLLSPKSRSNNQKETLLTPKSERQSQRINTQQSPMTESKNYSPQKKIVKRGIKRRRSSYRKLGILEVADISSCESPKRKSAPKRKGRKLR